jgi:hypothetical protein
MKGAPAPKPLWPDDGQEWKKIEKWQDVTPFAGKLVAFRTKGVLKKVYKINPGDNDPTCFGLVQDRHKEFRDYAGSNYGYYVDICQSWKRWHLGIPRTLPLLAHEIAWRPTLMRLVTFREICQIFGAIKRHKICCVERSFDPGILVSLLPRPGLMNTYFKLDNLTEKERKPYFRSQVHKTFWEKHRLLWLSRSESGSALYGVPKDIVRLLARQVFDAEVEEMQQKSKLDDRLFLE